MKILFCCENFYPSIGGVQEVVLQIAKRLTKKHDVTLATTFRAERNFEIYKNIKIKQFKIYGNYVTKIYGDVKAYRKLIFEEDFDYIFFYAAQQWTFDVILDDLHKVRSKIIFVPCGFSGLKFKIYSKYFNKLLTKLKYIDHFVFHTKEYQDFEFLKKNLKSSQYSIITNGACLEEFKKLKSKTQHKRDLGINESFLILLNSSLSIDKGQLEFINAMKNFKSTKKIRIIINANYENSSNLYKFFISLLKFFYKFFIYRQVQLNPSLIYWFIKYKSLQLNRNVKLSIVNLPRDKLINIYKASDLFIFTSKIEYCPLVVYESMASQTAFISSDVGNVNAVIKKYNSGMLCKKIKTNNNLVQFSSSDLIKKINHLVVDSTKRELLAKNGREAFLKELNWNKIFISYAKLFK